LIPVVDRMVKMDLRVITIDVAKQEVMPGDNVPATVDAVVYFRVVDPNAAVVKVENFWKATSLIAQTTLRSVLGQAPLDDLLSQRDVINQKLQEIIDRQTEPWGIKVTAVEVKDVALPDSMKRAMAKQAEAERERRAKIVNAEGEYDMKVLLIYPPLRKHSGASGMCPGAELCSGPDPLVGARPTHSGSKCLNNRKLCYYEGKDL